MVADVEAVYGVAGRQFDISEQSVPATAVGGYDEAIEKEGENEDCNEATDPERAVVGVSERTFGPREWGRRLLAVVSFFSFGARAFSLSVLCLYQTPCES